MACTHLPVSIENRITAQCRGLLIVDKVGFGGYYSVVIKTHGNVKENIGNHSSFRNSLVRLHRACRPPDSQTTADHFAPDQTPEARVVHL